MTKGGPEAQVARELRAFLEDKGWRYVRMESGYVPGAGNIGEKGIPDGLWVFYIPGKRGLAALMWIETKPTGYKPRCDCKPAMMGPGKRPGTLKQIKAARECRWHGQQRWRRDEEARGALVLTVSDVPAFIAEYSRVFSWLPVEKGQMSLC